MSPFRKPSDLGVPCKNHLREVQTLLEEDGHYIYGYKHNEEGSPREAPIYVYLRSSATHLGRCVWSNHFWLLLAVNTSGEIGKLLSVLSHGVKLSRATLLCEARISVMKDDSNKFGSSPRTRRH